MSDEAGESPYRARTFVDPALLRADLQFTEASLDDAMTNQAALFADYAQKAVQAQHHHDMLKNILEIKEAKLDKAIRDDAAVTGMKLTEAAIAREIALNPEVVRFKHEVSRAKAQADLARQALEAFKQRRDMLIQIGVNRREERQGELRIAGSIARNDANDAALRSAGKEAIERLRQRNEAA